MRLPGRQVLASHATAPAVACGDRRGSRQAGPRSRCRTVPPCSIAQRAQVQKQYIGRWRPRAAGLLRCCTTSSLFTDRGCWCRWQGSSLGGRPPGPSECSLPHPNPSNFIAPAQPPVPALGWVMAVSSSICSVPPSSSSSGARPSPGCDGGPAPECCTPPWPPESHCSLPIFLSCRPFFSTQTSSQLVPANFLHVIHAWTQTLALPPLP